MFGDDPIRVGQFLGTTIHYTAQVAGAGLLYSDRFGAPEALNSAKITKLVRNKFIIGVIPMMAFLYRRQAGPVSERPQWFEFVPLFVIGFVAMVAMRTLGDFYQIEHDTRHWATLLSSASWLSNTLLIMAMAGVGLCTSISKLRDIGLKPMSVDLVATALVGCVSALLLSALSKTW